MSGPSMHLARQARAGVTARFARARRWSRLQAVFPPLLLAATLLSTPSLRGGDLVISEFVAVNTTTLRDEDGDSSDWIEIQNTGSAAVSLLGWSLTDRQTDLRRWVCPDVSLGPGEFLVVFASGKDRRDPSGELHASFRLRGDGEYLALVRPDGTVEHEFAPFYPEQRTDISYGLSSEVAPLVGEGSGLVYTVPRDDSLGDAWIAPGFSPDARWNEGIAGLGFDESDTGGPLAPPVGSWGLDGGFEDGGTTGDARYVGSTPRWTDGFDGVPRGALELDGSDYLELPAGGPLPLYNQPAYTVAMWVRGLPQNDRRIYSEGSASNRTPLLTIGTDVSGNSGKLDIFIRSASAGTIVNHRLSDGIVFDGTWHHVTWVDEGGNARVYIDGLPDFVDFSYPKTPLSLDVVSIGSVLRDNACCHYTGAIDGIGLWDRALSTDEVELLASGVSPGGGSGYGGLIATDVGADMLGQGGSIYARIPFSLGGADVIDTLTLDMRYDDGFVAYLNGVEVARRRAPALLSWSSSASGEHAGSAAIRPERISLGGAVDLLVEGDNVLAIHGLNVSPEDESFLLLPDLVASGSLAAQLGYFREPTPGAPNGGSLADFVRDTRFSVDRGFFEEPTLVEITTGTPGAEIRYTTDGTAPTATRGELYTGPILIDTTTTLRAAAFRDGFLPTNVDTHTYIFLGDVIRQPPLPPGYPSSWAGNPADYAMDPEIATDTRSPHYEPTIKEDLRAIPTLSLVLDPDDFVGPTRGIYTHPLNRGVSWERPGSAELILPDGSTAFQIDCGVRIHGNSSARPIEGKHSFRLLFKSIYGDSKLRHPLFEDSDVEEFDTLVLRCFSTDSWHFKDGGSRYRRWDSQYIRDVWMRDTQLAMGHPSSHSTYVHLYVNGLYWGLYNPSERPDDSFQTSYFGGDDEEWDIVKDFNELFRGRKDSWNLLMSLADSGLASDAAYQRLLGNDPDGTPNPAYPVLLDADNLIDYMILHIYGCAEDWPHHNWYAARNRSGELGGWRFFVWDQEIVMDFVFRNRVGVSNDNSPARVYSRLRANREFVVRFGDRLEKHLFHDGALSVEESRARWMRRAREIDRAIVGESARWGDFREDVPDPSNTPATLYTREDHWLPELAKVTDEYIPQSNRLALERFRAVGLYPSIDPPAFSQHGGAAPEGFRLRITAPAGTAYYTLDGSDPRLRGGEVSPTALTAGETAAVTLLESPAAARFLVPSGPELGLAWTEPDFDDASWQEAMTGIGYERSSGFEEEIRTDVEGAMHDVNPSIYIRVPFEVADPAAFAFLSLSVKYDDGYIAYLNGIEVERRNAPTDAVWNSRAAGSHPDSQALEFESRDISLGLDALRSGTNVLAVHGLNASPTSSDFLITPELGGGRASSSGIAIEETTTVRSRALFGREWSALVEATFYTDLPLPLRVTEIMYHPLDPPSDSPHSGGDFEFIELANVGAQRISLDAVRFTRGIDFDFSASEVTHLEPGEVVVLVRDPEAFPSRYDTRSIRVAGEYAGALANEGETLRLEDPLGDVILEFAYSPDWYPLTDGQGLSLEIDDALAPPASWGESSGWREGPLLGSPGRHAVTPPPGDLARPGDANGDGRLDISDPIALLRSLFAGGTLQLPCDGGAAEGGNLTVLDLNGDTNVDLSDAVHSLMFLFVGGEPPAAGSACVPLEGCRGVCAP